MAKDKNVLFVFTDGGKRSEDETISFVEVTDYQSNPAHNVPRVYAMYYTGNGVDENVKLTLEGVSVPRDSAGTIMKERQGSYKPSDDMHAVLRNFEEVVNDAMTALAEQLKPIDDDIHATANVISALRDLDKDGKGVPDDKKKDLEENEKKEHELRDKKNALIGKYAEAQPRVKQLIDIALLAGGLLKGEALSKFLHRSVDLL